MLFLFLRDELGLFESRGRLLHFAPERCLEEPIRRIEGLEYVSVDLTPGRAMVCADITDLPFDDDAFDFVICSHVLEHVEDDRKAIAGLFRILKPGGYAVVVVPIRREQTYEDPTVTEPEERLRHFGQADHVREPGADYHLRLSEAGFAVERRPYALELPQEDQRRFGLRGNELYVCTKGR